MTFTQRAFRPEIDTALFRKPRRQLDHGQSLRNEEKHGGDQPHQQRSGTEFRRGPKMPETQHRDQIEQDQIAQFERAYELRGGLRRLRSHKPRKRGSNELQRINPEMIVENEPTVVSVRAASQFRTALAKRSR